MILAGTHSRLTGAGQLDLKVRRRGRGLYRARWLLRGRRLGVPEMPRDNNPLDQLSSILAALGPTPDGVAEALRTSGCRGYRCGGFPSPVIRFAYRRFDTGSLVLVYSAPGKPSSLYLYTHDSIREELPLPSAVAEFLARFDAGAYPDLDMEAVRTSA